MPNSPRPPSGITCNLRSEIGSKRFQRTRSPETPSVSRCLASAGDGIFFRSVPKTGAIALCRRRGPVNDQGVGTITATPRTSYTNQTMAVAGIQLNDGNNHMVPQNVTDAFDLQDVICFSRQSA